MLQSRVDDPIGWINTKKVLLSSRLVSLGQWLKRFSVFLEIYRPWYQNLRVARLSMLFPSDFYKIAREFFYKTLEKVIIY